MNVKFDKQVLKTQGHFILIRSEVDVHAEIIWQAIKDPVEALLSGQMYALVNKGEQRTGWRGFQPSVIIVDAWAALPLSKQMTRHS